MKRNYQKELDKILTKLESADKVPTLLLHSCCAPCSSYCIEYLSNYFNITIFYYNPNISLEDEYRKRVEEQKRLIASLPVKYSVDFIEGNYDTERFYKISKGLEQEKEGGKRCFLCYRLRLEEAVKIAKEKNFDYVTTTLSISPYKNAEKLNDIGEELERIYEVNYLSSDFKKKNGYKRSIELSKEYDLYRQDYCGCIYSREQRINEKKN